MDEYYCPNCGATLNNQPGFDPDGGTWTCTSCGKHLMDDDVYEGDTYEGVAWYCDECDALLNRQSGFSDSYDTWTCTECGHVNGTTEDDIYESEDDYKYQKTVDAAVDFVGSIVSGIISGVSSALSEEDDEDEDDEDDDVYCNEDEDESKKPVVKQPRQKTEAELEFEQKQREKLRQELIRKTEKAKNSELRKKRAKAFVFKHKRISTSISSSELVGSNYSKAKEHFIDEGFTNVSVHALKDIYIDSTKTDGEIEQITINGIPSFDDTYMCPYDSEIIIVYHTKREFVFPYNAKKVNKLDYMSCINKLKEIGFTNISIEPISDLVTGWIKKDGSIEEISIDGNNLFKEGKGVPYDSKIIIKYHTFTHKK